MAERFYTAEPLSPGPWTLAGSEAHHIRDVLRLKPGDPITLFNGDGLEYPARIERIEKRHIEVLVSSGLARSREPARQVTVASPLPKGDRAAFLVEKLTELGVTRYIPLHTDRSILRPGERKTQKLRRYVIEASKQCGRNVLMRIDEAMPWSELAKAPGDASGVRLIADIQGAPLSGLSSDSSAIVAIGPEGGWTSDEREQAVGLGWQSFSLGRSILRIETAALAAAARLLG
jgi:16S rRNA (uracil1498-N3)-methyltransferase